jgi:hypothetical protein
MMMNARAFLIAMALLVLALGVKPVEAKKETETFSGQYDWSQGGSDRMSAEFEPEGADSWKVTFRFRFSGRSETWKGTANGSLADGSTLSGTATSGNRNWIFEADIEDGVMRGSHREIKRSGREYPTGTFKISR